MEWILNLHSAWQLWKFAAPITKLIDRSSAVATLHVVPYNFWGLRATNELSFAATYNSLQYDQCSTGGQGHPIQVDAFKGCNIFKMTQVS
jgi:hypothetical protein